MNSAIDSKFRYILSQMAVIGDTRDWQALHVGATELRSTRSLNSNIPIKKK